ncbi:MAG: alpha/beta hydrolase [Clostridia bacterium]|nr:alpha/beta hydrolase [Clostridia bacterium]
MIAFFIVLGVLSLLLFFALFIPYRIAYARVYKPDLTMDYQGRDEFVKELFDKANETPYEHVEVRSYDGLKLVGRYYERRAGAPTVLFFHGYRSTPLRDGCGILRITETSGYNLLLVYQRSHGMSEGNFITFGVKESKDVMTWCRFLQDKTDKIYLGGISMGASTVLNASKYDLPNVKAIVADCGFSSPAEIIFHVIDKKFKWAYFLAEWSAKLFCGFSVKESMTDAVSKSKYPILFIHGECDRFVPLSMTLKNHEACTSEKRLELFPTAQHAMSYIVDPERYQSVVLDFLSDK